MVSTWLFACVASDNGLQNGQGGNPEPEGAGVLQVSAEALTLTDLAVGFSENTTLGVTSAGENNLAIYGARLVANPDAQFYFEEVEDVELAPGASLEWVVVATLEAAEDVTGKLRIESNDLDNPTLYIPVCAYPTGSTTDPATCGVEPDTGGPDSGA